MLLCGDGDDGGGVGDGDGDGDVWLALLYDGG